MQQESDAQLSEYFQASIIVIILKITTVLSFRTLSQIFGIGASVKSVVGAMTFQDPVKSKNQRDF